MSRSYHASAVNTSLGLSGEIPPPVLPYQTWLELGIDWEACEPVSPPSPPALLDTRGQLDVGLEDESSQHLSKVKRQVLRQKQVNNRVMDVMIDAFRTGELRGHPLDYYYLDAEQVTLGWTTRMRNCGDQLWLFRCPNDGHLSPQFKCCHVPVCAFDQHRDAAEWRGRADTLKAVMPSKMRYGQLVKHLGRFHLKIPQQARALLTAERELRWRLVTIGLRDTGDLVLDIERTIGPRGKDVGLRKRFVRWLESRGMIAGFIPVDVGKKNGHVHLHALIYSPFIPRHAIKRWLQSQDCTVPGCRHTPDDRCDECKAAERDCTHPHKDGSPRCNGSWDADIKEAYDPREALKYAVSTDAPAELQLAVALALYKRNRVLTYGLAKPGCVPRVDDCARALEAGCCPLCGARMVPFREGRWRVDAFTWTRAGPS